MHILNACPVLQQLDTATASSTTVGGGLARQFAAEPLAVATDDIVLVADRCVENAVEHTMVQGS